jgi:hypothetical protein
MKAYRTKTLALGLMLVVGVAGVMAGERAALLTLDWNTIDAGGVMRSTADSLELSGTLGQFDAGGPLTRAGLELTGGFWFQLAPGDCNADGGVNLYDHADFEACMVGPFIEPDPQCPCFDLDGDTDIDLADFAKFQTGFSGY